MRIFILALGTRGDLEPFWALARALVSAGHAVTLGTSGFHIQHDPSIIWLQIGNGSFEAFNGLLSSLAGEPDRTQRTMAFGRRWAMPQVHGSQEVFTSAVARHDYFIGNMKFPLMVGGAVFPGAFVTYDPPESLEAVRSSSGLTHDGRTLDLVALNRELLDPGAEWGANFHFTGFWGAQRSDIARPPALADFIASGLPPVVLTMGSMVMFDARALAETFRAALQKLGRRGVLVSGWSGRQPGLSEDGDLLTVTEADYRWLFPQSACVIHHGGAGTVAAVLAAGVPQVLLPQVDSQQRWGQVLMREQLCTGVLMTESLTGQVLAEAIHQALARESVQQAAQVWAARVAQDRGIAHAVELIDQHMKSLHARGILPRRTTAG